MLKHSVPHAPPILVTLRIEYRNFRKSDRISEKFSLPQVGIEPTTIACTVKDFTYDGIIIYVIRIIYWIIAKIVNTILHWKITQRN